jgi:hypothetical protein
LGGGEDWYDVWSEGEPYGWLTDFKEFFRSLGFILALGLGLGFLWVISPSTPNSYRPSYDESTPIKVVSSTPAKPHKKNIHKKKNYSQKTRCQTKNSLAITKAL